MVYVFSLSVEQTQVIFTALEGQPYRDVAALIHDMGSQLNAQNAAQAGGPAPEVKKDPEPKPGVPDAEKYGELAEPAYEPKSARKA